MKLALTANEYYYRKIVTSVGCTMLLFLAIFSCVSLVISFLPLFLTNTLALPEIAADVAYHLVYAAGYLLSFMLPVMLLRFLIGQSGYPYHSMKCGIRLSPALGAIVAGGILIIWAQAFFNAALVDIIDYSSFSSEKLWGNTGMLKNYQIVLQFIVTGMVPAFCEEFLFRGAILTNLLPFGRGNAIFISALLFGLMHQNAEQILYAFGAGILLGVVYERTGSIWNCTFLHLVNNFSSIVIGAIATGAGGKAGIAEIVGEGILLLIGVACIPLLVGVLTPKKTDFREGVFGRSVPVADDYASCAVSPKRAFRLFFSFPMVMFLVFCILMILLLFIMAVFYGSL